MERGVNLPLTPLLLLSMVFSNHPAPETELAFIGTDLVAQWVYFLSRFTG